MTSLLLSLISVVCNADQRFNGLIGTTDFHTTASIVAPSASVSAYDNATQLPQCSARDSAADHVEKADNGLHVLDILGTGTGIGRAIPMRDIRDLRTCTPILARVVAAMVLLILIFCRTSHWYDNGARRIRQAALRSIEFAVAGAIVGALAAPGQRHWPCTDRGDRSGAELKSGVLVRGG